MGWDATPGLLAQYHDVFAVVVGMFLGWSHVEGPFASELFLHQSSSMHAIRHAETRFMRFGRASNG